MLVKDIIADARSSRGFGTCDEATLYSVLTEAVQMLSNKVREWDFLISRAEFCAFDGFLTLPREVETPLAATINGKAAWGRDKWFVHHINGPGCHSSTSNSYWDEVDQTSTFRNVPWPAFLMGTPENVADIGKEMLVYGYDYLDKELQHQDDDGNWVRGIRVIITNDNIVNYPDPVQVKQITRVVKGETAGAVRLWAIDPCGVDEVTMLGYYYPDEAEPRYRRLRFPNESKVLLTYRRKNLTIQAENDFIPFDSKLALLMALRSLRYMYDGNLAQSQAFEEKAIDLLRNEENAKRVMTSVGPQVRNYSSNNNERLRGSWRNC